jgi:hypothetical protein
VRLAASDFKVSNGLRCRFPQIFDDVFDEAITATKSHAPVELGVEAESPATMITT